MDDVIFCRIFLMSIAISPKTTTKSAEQILGSGESNAALEPARAVRLVCQNDKVESSRSAEKILGSGEKYRCPRTRHYISLTEELKICELIF